MRVRRAVRTLILAAIPMLCACSSSSGASSDGAPPSGDARASRDGGAASDRGASPDAAATTFRVAGVQYADGDFSKVPGCGDDLCGLTHFVKDAAKKGARLVVTPEYAIDQKTSEPAPAKGDALTTDARFTDGSILRTLGKLADELNVTLVFNLITQEGSGGAAKLHNTQVAVGPDGKVLARHYKFHLFGGEGKQLAPGTHVTENYFDTPVGKAGLLICADIQCSVNGVGPDCAADEMKLLQEFVAQKPALALFSAYWTVGPANAGSSIWWPLNVQKNFATQTKMFVVAANTTKAPGAGGGIFDPEGATLASSELNTPAVVLADLPLPKK
ncbi:MAG: carbon-nitrogen hydrolase family protein [Deltaproteobacteria bacterium]|nr:carbon-nitrogen hydrolase family protein [Deltaproteobacteria bacterium]